MIAYHGTDEATAQIILMEGFKESTHFARHLEDALAFGGAYVFAVLFEDEDEWFGLGWQTVYPQSVSNEKILWLQKFEGSWLFQNYKLTAEQDRETSNYGDCQKCGGAGEYRQGGFIRDDRWRLCLACEDCRGYGDIRKAEEAA